MWPFKKFDIDNAGWKEVLKKNECEPANRFVKCLHKMHELQDIFKDTHGNLSWNFFNSSMSSGETVIKPSGVSYKDVVVEDLPLIQFIKEDGYVPYRGWVSLSPKKPSVDSIHHLKIYENNREVKAICHTHSPYATAFALAGKDIKCYSTEQSDYFGGHIRCLPYSDLNNWGEKIGTTNDKAILLGRHGVITMSEKDPEDAINLAVAVENLAMKSYLALTLNQRMQPLTSEEVQKWHDRYQNSYGQK